MCSDGATRRSRQARRKQKFSDKATRLALLAPNAFLQSCRAVFLQQSLYENDGNEKRCFTKTPGIDP